MNTENTYANITTLRTQQERNLNYGVIANLGTMALILSGSFISLPIIMGTATTVGVAAIFDSQWRRAQFNKKVRQAETQFVQIHGNSQERETVQHISDEEKKRVKIYTLKSGLALGGVLAGFLAAHNLLPDASSVMMTVTAIVASAVVLNVPGVKKEEKIIDRLRKQRAEVADRLSARQPSASPEPPRSPGCKI